MSEMIYRIIAVAGLLVVVAGNYFSLKTKTRKKYTYLLLTLGAVALLIYSISIDDFIFIILQALVIVTSLIEYYLVHIKKIRTSKIQSSKLKS